MAQDFVVADRDAEVFDCDLGIGLAHSSILYCQRYYLSRSRFLFQCMETALLGGNI